MAGSPKRRQKRELGLLPPVDPQKQVRHVTKDVLRFHEEKGYVDAVVSLVPQFVEQDRKINALTDRLLDISDLEELVKVQSLLKTLLAERAEIRNRLWGKTTSRAKIDTTNTSFAVDVAELVRLGREDEGIVIEGREA